MDWVGVVTGPSSIPKFRVRLNHLNAAGFCRHQASAREKLVKGSDPWDAFCRKILPNNQHNHSQRPLFLINGSNHA